MEVGETPSSLNSVRQGVEVVAVAWEPLGIIHQEHLAELACGGNDGWDVAARFVSSDFSIDAILHAGHRAPLPHAGTQARGGWGAAVSPPHVDFQGAVVALQSPGVTFGDSSGGQDGVLGVMVEGPVRVADIVRQDQRLEAPPPAVPPHVVEDAEELHRGAVGGHPELVGRQNAARHQARLIVVFEQGGGELPYRGKVRERPAVGDRAMGLLFGEVDEICGMCLGHWRPAEDVVDQVCDNGKRGVLQLSEKPVFQ